MLNESFRSLESAPRARGFARRRFVPSLAALLVLGSASVAHAADYYVALMGSDGTAGTLAEPFRTIRQGISVAQPGDTVWVRAGIYRGYENQINPIRSGRADAFITIRAYTGELPILEPTSDIGAGSAFEPLPPSDGFVPENRPVQFIRIEGFAARNWPSTGFSSGYVEGSTQPGGQNIQIRHCIAEGNGISGIAMYYSRDFVIENNIVGHNGNLPPSWSSGVNLFTVQGAAATNIVRGNVSFENIDVCGDPAAGACNAARSTDGNGFIMDENSVGALFENNLGFRNGGSCLRLTRSSNAQLVNNTCFSNGLDTGYSTVFSPDEIFFSDQASRTGVSLRNNVVVPSGRAVTNFAGFEGTNVFNGAQNLFRAANGARLDLRPAASAATLINRAAGGSPATDLGFDPACLKQVTNQPVAFWQYAPDYSYIASIGGIAACFRPVARTAGATEMGAYELPPAGCVFSADCSDGNACSADTCSAGQCTNPALANCCTADSACDDGNPCTTDTCETAARVCGHSTVTGCCAADAACNDNDACSYDTCDPTSHQCTHLLIDRCTASPPPVCMP
jgi:parallel beta-helix repeat protein